MGVEAILLAAGESSRMGKPKALLDWFGVSLVEAQIASLTEGGVDHVIVVTGAHHGEISAVASDVPKAQVVNNPHWASGKTTSIKAGLSVLSGDCDTIVLLAVDQPRPAWVVQRALDSHRRTRTPVTSPRFSGHGGHPLFFDGSLLDELANISEEREGVREVIKKHEDSMNRVCFESSVVRLDLNTPEDYETARSIYPSLAEAT